MTAPRADTRILFHSYCLSVLTDSGDGSASGPRPFSSTSRPLPLRWRVSTFAW